ncbi:sensor histidine kinase efflux regulator BaeS [Pseudogulbenkiania subflava]|uniref:histidine kinase n=1 Tax=Pseudogulbenkiania subflava DSM 22618 TaxID=1123014 RepID=A0A1Y6CBQ2_9NEIS|nr:sensor histidine kinase efflux regulator BaeS [Pseudogulbenkiania subflava]SMF46563.1 two-component system, OmpR family, sensor histidine kinase BaeS [Pseudogulbenkiania subflava DSM 22618]
MMPFRPEAALPPDAFMKLGITSKLFFAILFCCVVVALAIGAASRLSFKQGFLDYVSQRDAQRLETLKTSLVEAYREEGSWAFLEGNERLWRRLVRAEVHPERAPGRPDHPPHPGFRLPLPPLTLLAADGHVVAGAPNWPSDATRTALQLDGRPVGWLVSVPVSSLTNAADLRFQEGQLKAGWLFAVLGVLLAAAVAMLLARVMLVPVKRLAAALHELATGDYSTRVQASSRDELGQLAGDFNRLARVLENNEQMRRHFMADISHELRTPLAVLRGELEAMEDGVRTPTPEALKSLQAEVSTLSKLVDDLYELSLADVGALSYHMEVFDPADVLQQALNAFGERLQGQSIRLETRLPQGGGWTIEADPQRLLQLFNNLLENVVRYTDRGGRLRVSVSRDGECLRIDFQDSEPAVPSDALPRLFERLYRVEGSRNRASGGAGLGLALCRSIVEAHGGTIEARPSPLGGLWISLTFPLRMR